MKTRRHIFTALISVALLLLCACADETTALEMPPESSGTLTLPSPYIKISPEEAQELMTADAIVVDVRTSEEFAAEHIPNAVLLPYDEIEEKAETVLGDKGQVIILYCRTGIRSENAARALLAMGYSQVYDLGGIADWPHETVKAEASTVAAFFTPADNN